MIKFLITLTTAAFLASTVAYGETAAPDPSHSAHHKKSTADTPSAEDATSIQDVPPHVVQWFGKAVDDILTDTGKAIDPDAKR